MPSFLNNIVPSNIKNSATAVQSTIGRMLWSEMSDS